MKKALIAVLVVVVGVVVWNQVKGPKNSTSAQQENATSELTGIVKIDGSSTVFPITEAIAEEFQKQNPKVRVTVGISGTGGGFKKFLANEIDINNASRVIKPQEVSLATEKQIEYIELPVAFDGLSVVVNKQNDFVDHLTLEELRKIWQPNSTVKTWHDIRPGWPKKEIKLYGPGTDSGTFDYFTHAVNGKSGASRSDYTASEDDNVLVKGIIGDENALGYFGFAYFKESQEKIKVVPIDGGMGPVIPSEETINNGSYIPLSRPVFIYVNTVSASKPHINKFVNFYLDFSRDIVHEVGYVALPEEVYNLVKSRFNQKTIGSAFSGESVIGKTVEDLLTASL